MELCLRTGQLSIVSLMGRGTPVPAKVLLCSRGVKNAVLVGDKHGDQRSEVRGRRSEDSKTTRGWGETETR